MSKYSHIINDERDMLGSMTFSITLASNGFLNASARRRPEPAMATQATAIRTLRFFTGSIFNLRGFGFKLEGDGRVAVDSRALQTEVVQKRMDQPYG